jgi:hypothetical protein
MTKNGYTTNSKKINQIIEEHGIETFEVVKIRLVEDAYDYETRFLRKVNAAKNKKFYNGHNNTLAVLGSEEFYGAMKKQYGTTHALKVPEIKKKAMAKKKETTSSLEWKETVGRPATEKMKETKNSPEWKNTIGKEMRRKMSESKKDNPKAYAAAISNGKKGADATRGIPRPEHLKKQWSEKKRGVLKTNLEKQNMSNARSALAQREIVKIIREESKKQKTKLGTNWWTKSDEDLLILYQKLTTSHSS